jgi:hypothetical protein
MAVTPNTTFSSGQILTAAQMNAFPRGLMTDIVTSTTSYNLTTSFVTQITSGSFTAVAGRLYRVMYYEPVSKGNSAVGTTTNDFQLKNGATVLQAVSTPATSTSALYSPAVLIYVGALTAGATVITGLATTGSTTGTPQLQRSATSPAFITIEDIGAA